MSFVAAHAALWGQFWQQKLAQWDWGRTLAQVETELRRDRALRAASLQAWKL